jgi:hypothetical protein
MTDLSSKSDLDVRTKEERARDPENWWHRGMDAYRRGDTPLAFRPGADFFELADFVVDPKRTMLSHNRLYVFWQVASNVARVPGAIAEIGTYKGGSAYFIARAAAMFAGVEVPMHVFDTFEGHPQAAISDHDVYQKRGKFSGTSYEDVREYLSPFPQLQVHKGDIVALLPSLTESAYRFVHIDTDLYQPTVACLDYFGARLSPGGVIVVDDYASPKCPGVPKAVLEYLERVTDYQVWDLRTEQLMLVKQ